ncbi:MAG: tetratricopeptide repeat protein [Saprospiraceae bacterium]
MNRKFQLEQMLKDEPNNSFLLFAMAKEYESEMNYLEAIQSLESLRTKDPNYTGLYYHLSAIYRKNNQITEAKSILDTGIEICTKLNAHHDLSELKSSKINLEIELMED